MINNPDDDNLTFRMWMTPVPYEEWENHPHIPSNLGEEWSNHSYIVRSYNYMERTELLGPIPDVLMGEVMKELEDSFRFTVTDTYNDLVKSMRKGLDEYRDESS